MNEINLLSLNDDCFYEIFNLIKIQCETEEFAKYSVQVLYTNLINFVVSSNRITKAFYGWDKQLFSRLRIINYIEAGSFCIDFASYYNNINKATETNRISFWNSIVAKIENHPRLLKVHLRYLPDFHYNGHIEIFDKIVRALQNKHELKELEIILNGYTLDNLPKFPHLESLHLDARINADVLVECCQLNPNLRELYIMSSDIYGELADIALDENILQKLEVLTFKMKDDIDAIKYAPLAKLPKVNNLLIKGVHKVGSLSHLFRALAAKNTKRYPRFLGITEAQINDVEAEAISQINSLEHLVSGFIDAGYIGQLDQLNNLSRLEITSSHDEIKLIPEVFKILRNSKVPGILIEVDDGHFEYTQITEELVYQFQLEYEAEFDFCYGLPLLQEKPPQNIEDPSQTLIEEVDFSEKILEMAALKPISRLNGTFPKLSRIDLLSQLEHLQELTLLIPSDLHYIANKQLESLFRLLASKLSPTLQYLDIKGVAIDSNSTKELVKIKSLKSVKCSFIDPDDIPLLSALMQLNQLTIRSIHELKSLLDGIYQIITSPCPRKICIDCSSPFIMIQYDGNKEQLVLTMKEIVQVTQSTEEKSKSKLSSVKTFFQTFVESEAACIKKLRVTCDPSILEWIPLPFKWLYRDQLVQMTFSDPLSLETLQRLSQIKSQYNPQDIMNLLTSNPSTDTCGVITISNIYGNIIINKNCTSSSLTITETDKETLFDVNDAVYLRNLENLETIHIEASLDRSFLTQLFSEMASKPLTKLIIEQNIRISFEELLNVVKIKSLKFLKCGFFEILNIEVIAQLKNLQELIITTHQRCSLKALFIEISLQPSPRLQYLTIENESLTEEELKAIGRINSLRKLDCIFNNRGHLPSFSHLKELWIRSQRTRRLFSEPEIYSTSSLQELTIVEHPLEVEEIKAVSQHKSLRKLKIKLRKLESIQLLSSLMELKEVDVELITKKESLTVPLKFLKVPQNISKLTIHNLIIGSKDIEKVLQIRSSDPLYSVLNQTKDLYIDILLGPNKPAIEISSLKYPQDFSDVILSDCENLPEILQFDQLVISLNEKSAIEKVFESLAQKRNTSLNHLSINHKFLNEREMLFISQIISLTTLQCELNNNENIKYLKELKNLKRLTITFECFVDPLHIYRIVRECKNLELFENRNIKVDTQIIKDINQILKEVRNPSLQKPLEFVVSNIPTDFEKLTYIDPRYLVIKEL